MAAERRTERSKDADDGNANDEVVPRLHGDRAHDDEPPIGADQTDDGHENDASGRGHLLADAEQQREHAEAADVDAAADERCERPADETGEQQRDRLPQDEVGNPRERASLTGAIEQVERNGERKPHADEDDFLLSRRQVRVDEVQADDRAYTAADAAVDEGVPFDLDALEEDGERRRRHAHRLDHHGEVTCHRRRDSHRERHDRERDGSAAFARHSCERRRDVTGDSSSRNTRHNDGR